VQSIAPPANQKSGTDHPPATPEDCARAVLEGVPAVMWFVRRQLRSRRAKGLSVPQFRVMLLAEKCDRLGLSSVSANLGVSVPTASRIVSGLVEKGFLDRSVTEGDRRCRPIRLTTAGQAALKTAWNGTHDALTTVLAGLSPADCRQMTDAMRLLSGRIAAASDK